LPDYVVSVCSVENFEKNLDLFWINQRMHVQLQSHYNWNRKQKCNLKCFSFRTTLSYDVYLEDYLVRYSEMLLFLSLLRLVVQQ